MLSWKNRFRSHEEVNKKFGLSSGIGIFDFVVSPDDIEQMLHINLLVMLLLFTKFCLDIAHGLYTLPTVASMVTL